MFKCILCGDRRHEIVHKGLRDNDFIDVVRCNGCGHVQLNQFPKSDFYKENLQIKRLYSEIDIEKFRESSKFDTDRRYNFVQEYVKSNEPILEVGVGYGFLLEKMLENNFNVDGLEVSPDKKENVQLRLKKDILDWDLSSKEFCNSTGKKYDCIMMYQVFEHILSPNIFLENIRKIISKEGTIIIEVPNFDDNALKFSKEYLNFYYQEAHQSYFNFQILKDLLEKSGFNSVEAICHQRYSILNFMNWYINGKPQMSSPSYLVEDKIEWIDDYYRKKLCTEGSSDTLIVVAKASF